MTDEAKPKYERCPVCGFFKVPGTDEFKLFVVDLETRLQMNVEDNYCPDCLVYVEKELKNDRFRAEPEDTDAP